MKSDKRPQIMNLEIVQKACYTYQVQFLDEGVAEDISSFVVYFVIKEYRGDSDADAKLYKKITGHYSSSDGKSWIELDEDDTDLEAGNYYFEISYTDDDDYSEVVFSGEVRVGKALLQTRT